MRRPEGVARLGFVAIVAVSLAACAPSRVASPTITPTALPLATLPASPLALPATQTRSGYPPPPQPTETLDPYPNGTPTDYPPGFHPTYTPSPIIPTDIPSVTPTPVPTAITVPPVQTLAAGSVPSLPHDLLFVSQGSLMRWHGQTGQIETLLGSTGDIAFAADGRYRVSTNGRVLAYLRKVPGSVPDIYGTGPADIVTLDLATGAPTVIYASPVEAAGPPSLALSPSGDWVAYSPPLTFTVGAGLTATYPLPLDVTATDGSTPPRQVAQCRHVTNIEFNIGCGDPLWARAGRSLVWHDGVGLWWSDLEHSQRLLVANDILFEKGKPINIYSPVEWSPDDRFLLAWIYHYEGRHEAVVAIETGRVFAIPDSDEYGYTGTRVIWLQDGRLFVLHKVQTQGVDQSTHVSVVGEVWHIGSEPEALVLDQSFPLAADIGLIETIGDVVQLPNGQIMFSVLSESRSDYEARGLYVYTPASDELRKLTGLPPVGEYETATTTWASDGSGALVQMPDRPLYAPSDGSALYDLTSVIGDQVCCFTWLP